MGTRRLIALLRGINGVRVRKVAASDLCKVLSDIGYRSVRTLQNIGNIVFDCDSAGAEASAARIEEALVMKLGVPAKVTLLDAAQLDAIVADNSLRPLASDHARLMVAVLNSPEDLGKLEPLTRQDWLPEAFALGRHAAYIWCPQGVQASRAVAALGKALGDTVTSRNWNTISKLHALASI